MEGGAVHMGGGWGNPLDKVTNGGKKEEQSYGGHQVAILESVDDMTGDWEDRTSSAVMAKAAVLPLLTTSLFLDLEQD